MTMCVNPITKRIDGKIVTYPCGTCVECRMRAQNDITFRLTYEASKWKHSTFCTLTYNQENISRHELTEEEVASYKDAIVEHLAYVPANYAAMGETDDNFAYLSPDRIFPGTMVPDFDGRVIPLWIKRFRKRYHDRYHKNVDFAYYICNEYGPNTYRPHHHAIFFFNCDVRIIQSLLVDDWTFGNVDDFHEIVGDGNTNFGSEFSKPMSYVAMYTKKLEEAMSPYEKFKIVKKPRTYSSIGIGAGYEQIKLRQLKDLNKQFKGNGKYGNYHLYNRDYIEAIQDNILKIVDNNGFSHPIPRYWKERILPTTFKEYKTLKKNKKTDKYEEVIQKRKVIDKFNTLCCALTCLMEDRILERYQQEYELAQNGNPDATDAEIARAVEAKRLADNRLRSQSKKSKSLSRYFRNKLKFKKL